MKGHSYFDFLLAGWSSPRKGAIMERIVSG